MEIIIVILLIALLATIVWFITTFIPMNAEFKKLIIAVAIIFAVCFVLQQIGILPRFHELRLR